MRLSKQTPFVQPQATYVFVSGNFLFKILYSKQPCTYYLRLRNPGQKLLLAQCTNMTRLKTFRLLCLKSDKNKTRGPGETVRLAALKKKQISTAVCATCLLGELVNAHLKTRSSLHKVQLCCSFRALVPGETAKPVSGPAKVSKSWQ